MSWDGFIVDMHARFEEDLSSGVVEDFNKLYDGTLDACFKKFENSKALETQRNPLLPFDYFVDSFIRGLKPQHKSFVRPINPQSSSEVVEYAKLQEGYVAIL